MPGNKNSIGDNSKLPLELIPESFYLGAARALQYGAEKYARHDWRKGLPWSAVYGALLRHSTAWWDGEEIDPESGLNHLDHMAANIVFLLEYARDTRYRVFDDRFSPEVITIREEFMWGEEVKADLNLGKLGE